MRAIKLFSSTLLCGALLSGCGGETELGFNTGLLNLKITDAPIDQATEVWVEFTGIELKPKEGSTTTIDFTAPQIINLLDLQGSEFAALLDQHTLRAGEYNWLRLKVNAEQAVYDSYIVFEDGSRNPLYVPSGDESGLKLNRGFTISTSQTADLTIDFDLRKSIVAPSSGTDYMLKPSLRLVQTNNTGHISGTVAPENFSHADCTGTDYAIYAYQGSNITPDDLGSVGAEPVITALLDSRDQYALGFLNAGDYTVALTCNAADDVLAEDNDLNYVGTSNVTVIAGQTTTYNF